MEPVGVLVLAVGGVIGACVVGVAATAVLSPESQPSSLSELSPGVLVTQVVDGDTLEIEGGRRVRLIGIDTPERGECGYEQAKQALEERVEGRKVTLLDPESVDDEDRYERLLRYVALGRADVGYEQLAAGLGVARYDSRDGYDPHPREARYRLASRTLESDCEQRERAREERRQATRESARRARVAARAEQRAAAAARAAAEKRRREALSAPPAPRPTPRPAPAPAPPPAPPPSSPSFTPPPGWTTDALTPGYTGCRQGYPGGLVDGVYVWKPIPC